jgi:hypothetical protein
MAVRPREFLGNGNTCQILADGKRWTRGTGHLMMRTLLATSKVDQRMPDSGFLQHVAITTIGSVRVASCLRCGFCVGGKRDDLLQKIMQQHQCVKERGPSENSAPAYGPADPQ